MSIAKLEQSVGWAWKAIILLAAAFGAAFLFMLDRIDDRFEANANKLDTIARDISRDISDLRVEVVEARHANDRHQPTVGEIRQSAESDASAR